MEKQGAKAYKNLNTINGLFPVKTFTGFFALPAYPPLVTSVNNGS